MADRSSTQLANCIATFLTGQGNHAECAIIDAPRREYITLHSRPTEFVLLRGFLNGDAYILPCLVSLNASPVQCPFTRQPGRAHTPHCQTLFVGFQSSFPFPGFRSGASPLPCQIACFTVPELARLV